ncbi:MAG: hypothetical protein OXH80_10890, partial [Nitrospira sp.]|nr:hypothetical protein [Nitrospira sp.]
SGQALGGTVDVSNTGNQPKDQTSHQTPRFSGQQVGIDAPPQPSAHYQGRKQIRADTHGLPQPRK